MDECGLTDDTCIAGGGGTWPGTGTGEADWCRGTYNACDKCHDGTDNQDLCKGSGDSTNGGVDTCFGATTDDCFKTKGDSDECRGGQGGATGDDKCPPGKQDDECPECEEGSDECRPGRESDDHPQGGSH